MSLSCFGSASSDRMPLPVWSSVLEVHAAAVWGGGRQLVHDSHLTVKSTCRDERVWDLKWWECSGYGGRR